MSRKFTSISRKLRGETGLGQVWSMFCSSSQLVFFFFLCDRAFWRHKVLYY